MPGIHRGCTALTGDLYPPGLAAEGQESISNGTKHLKGPELDVRLLQSERQSLT